MKNNSKWCIYLLVSGTRTYIGASTDVDRRLRQHNREIVGGARATAGRKWVLHRSVSGFRTKSEAYRWERIIKCRCRGVVNRTLGFMGMPLGVCPPGRKEYPVPKDLICHIYFDGDK